MSRKSMPVDTIGSEQVLRHADFADSYALTVDGQALDATEAASRAFGRAPRWITWLLALRNLLVAPFRLKTGRAKSASQPTVGFFPLLSRSADRLVLGLDDKHLDFRLVVEVTELGSGRQRITASTVVKTHNLFGRTYLAIVKPFHRRIVPAMLAQVAMADG